MTTPIIQIPKSDAGRYKGDRKLFLVPIFRISRDALEEGQKLDERYWSEVRDQVDKLERSLGKTSHVYHEAVVSEGEDGLRMVEAMNPRGCSFIQAMCRFGAKLEATDDRTLLEEISDWQRCIGIGLVSEMVLSTALDGYQQVTKRRFEHIASRIDETLVDDEAGVLFISDDHRIQFASDIRVFYVAPPALDSLKRWIDDQTRLVMQNLQQAKQSQEPDESEEK